MATSTGTAGVDEQVREVTDEEVAHHQEHGWVSLPGLVSRELASDLLKHLKSVTGLDYDELPRDHPDAAGVIDRIKEQGVGSIFHMSRLHDETVWDIVTSRKLGEASARLSGHRSMRLLTDGVICKLPRWAEETGVKAGIMTGRTPWHQDMPPMPVDRVGGVQFWLALCEITPEMGSMQHLSGSQREGQIGNVQYSEDQDVETLYPELFEKYPISPAHHFHPGDVLAHHLLSVHYAQENQTDRLRWVYTSYRVPSNTLYNGIPNPRFTEFGLTPWKPFDHPKFPIVAG
jgi:hypothetical protein